MSLWYGYHFNKREATPDPILTEIPVMRFDADEEPDIRVETASGVYLPYRPKKDQNGIPNKISTANGMCGLIAFPAGQTFFWFFPNEEIHYVVQGRAEMTYSLAGTSHTETKKMTLEPGDCYLVPRGARVTWKVAPGQLFKHLDFLMPGAPFAQNRRPGSVTTIRNN